MAKTISHCQGKGSLTHNTRAFVAKNVDPDRIKDNVIFARQELDEAYDLLFSPAVQRYNDKQKRSDRKIKTSYFEHLFKRSSAPPYVVTSSDKRKSFYEDLVQIGTMSDTGVGTADGKIAVECLIEYMNGFAARNPNFYVFDAVLHLDEQTPHLHIDYIPVGHYKQGVDTQNGLAQALKEMGYGTGKDAISRWREKERSVLEKICLEHGIEIAAPQKSRGSLTVEAYKEYVRVKEKVEEKQKEAEHLDGEIRSKSLTLQWREQAVTDAEAAIDRLDTEYQEKTAAVEQLDTELSEKTTALTDTTAALADNQAQLKASAGKVSQIKSIDSIDTKKSLFGGKVTMAQADFEKMSDLAKKQIAAESKEFSLQSRITSLENENKSLTADKAGLEEENTRLRNENGYLQSVNGKIAMAQVRSERDNLQRRLDRIMEFINSLGLVEKLQMFLNPKARGVRR